MCVKPFWLIEKSNAKEKSHEVTICLQQNKWKTANVEGEMFIKRKKCVTNGFCGCSTEDEFTILSSSLFRM